MAGKDEQLAAWHRDFLEQRLSRQGELAESQVIAHLVSALDSSGWHCEREISLPGRGLRVDLVIRHPALPFAGIVECKQSITGLHEAGAALKQASDYVGNFLPNGDKIEFAAVCPWQPPADPLCGHGCHMWGMLHIMATQFKVFAFISDRYYAVWRGRKEQHQDNLPGLEGSGFDARRLHLMQNEQNRVWSSDQGFVVNAVNMLAGKRQIGGSRQ